MDPMVIEVHGVPCIPPHDRMVDQLKIHFLKRRNSGGDVLTVIYPTSAPGQAYVIFESTEGMEDRYTLTVSYSLERAMSKTFGLPSCLPFVLVPGVLAHTHVLDVDNRFYPIHVKKAHLSEVKLFFPPHINSSPKCPRFPKHYPNYKPHFCLKFCVLFQVDMKVKTMLDLRMFPKPESVLKLLNNYGFNVTESGSGHVQLKGSFLKLKLIHSELIQLQGHGHHSHSKSPSAIHNGSSLGYDMERKSLDPRFVSKSTSRNMDKMDAVSQQQLLDNALSSSYRDSASGGSPRSLQSRHSSYTERNASSPMDAAVQKFQRLDSNELLAQRRSPHADGASSLSANSPSSLTSLHHTSPLYNDSASGGYPRSLHSSYYSSIGSTSYKVDTDIPNYVHTQQQNVMSNEMLVHRRSHLVDVPSSSKTSTYSPTMQHHTSYRYSPSNGSLRNFQDDTRARSTHTSPSSSSLGMASFLVDTDIINFILTQRQNDLKRIRKDYGTEMNIKDGVGFTTVTFLGNNSEKAEACLLNLIEEIGPSLRTQEIHLKEYDSVKKKQILERIEGNKDSGVSITHTDDVVKLVGDSRGSFEMMQKLLGHNDASHRGRAMERGSKSRRSSSLPRQYKMAANARVTTPENQASAASKYSPSHYQEKSDEGKAQQIFQGPEQIPDKKSQRIRSNSESRDKNRTTKEQALPQVELESPGRGKKSLKECGINFLKRLDPNTKNIDYRMAMRKKSHSTPKNPD